MSHSSDFGKHCAEVSIKLFEKLKAADGKENILISPLSIQTCMALVFSGAKGETASQVASAMGYNSQKPAEVAETFHNVLNDYEGSDLVKIANKVYVHDGCTLKADFMAVTKDKYHAEAEVINFLQQEMTAEKINSWVEGKTNGKITDLIQPSALREDTLFILLNALHFKGEWKEKFDPKFTEMGDFWQSQDQSVKMDFMFQEEKFNYAYSEDLQCSALEMFYADSDLSMFILLPEKRDGLKEVAQKLQGVNLLELAKRMHEIKVSVKFPKFKIEYAVEMSNVLREMGITKAFCDEADFRNIVEPAENICISKVLHKAVIEVNEEGTEAAAATAGIILCCMPPEFVADHPFFYWIWNKKKVILFAGAFVKAP